MKADLLHRRLTDDLSRRLTAEEERELAGVELVLRAGGIIRTIVERHCGDGIDFDTLLDVGTVEALRVIGDFDPDKGRLSTFLHPWVTGAVVKEVKRQLEEAPVMVRTTPSGDIEAVGARQEAKADGRGKAETKATLDTECERSQEEAVNLSWKQPLRGVDSDIVSWLRGREPSAPPLRDFEYRPGPSAEALERAEAQAERERQVQVVVTFVRMSSTRDLFVGLWGKQADREKDWEILSLRHRLGEINGAHKPERSWDVVAARVGMKKRTVEQRHFQAMKRLAAHIEQSTNSKGEVQ